MEAWEFGARSFGIGVRLEASAIMCERMAIFVGGLD